MFKERLLTASLVLLVFLMILFYSSPWVFALVLLPIAMLAIREWFRLMCLTPENVNVKTNFFLITYFTLLVLGASSILLRYGANWYLYWLLSVTVLWITLGIFMVTKGIQGWRQLHYILPTLMAAILIPGCWVALVGLRYQSLNLVLSALVMVWVADMSAYVIGRSLGGRFIKAKMAPEISPKKSFEGFIGAYLAILLTSGLWLGVEWYFNITTLSVPKIFLDYAGLLGLFIGLALLLAFAVLGDLFVSLLKRAKCVKDSGRLLPGHGGILDRIDALLPTMPLVMCLVALRAF
jgi:phosphatidate cytidylyltransferase